MNAKLFFKYARERYQIHLNRMMKMQKPWTRDSILQRYRFCQIFREDDRVTRWFRENWRGRDANVFGCVCFRFFNRVETGEVLVKNGLLDEWDARLAVRVLSHLKPLIGPAYRISVPQNGTRGTRAKLDGIIEVMRPVWTAHKNGKFDDFSELTLRRAHERLMEFPYVGPFMAYEAVCDLMHTPILNRAVDKYSWASCGPGAARGLARILEISLKTFNHGSAADRDEMVTHVQELVFKASMAKYWPSDWPHWDARTAEHTLCEFDKYERVRLGEGAPKQTYPGK